MSIESQNTTSDPTRGDIILVLIIIYLLKFILFSFFWMDLNTLKAVIYSEILERLRQEKIFKIELLRQTSSK